jgi:hypothetical protein
MPVHVVVAGTARAATVAAKTGVKTGQTAVKAGRAASHAGAKGARATSRTGRGIRNMTRPRRRNDRSSAQQNRQVQRGTRQHPLFKAGRVYSKTKHRIQQAKNTMEGLALTAFLFGFYFVQLLLAIIALIAFKVMSGTGFLAWFGELIYGAKTVAEGIYWVSWMLCAGLGTSLLIITALVSVFIYRLQVFRHISVIFMLCICLWGYWAPFFVFMFFPWAIIWLWVIIFAQK